MLRWGGLQFNSSFWPVRHASFFAASTIPASKVSFVDFAGVVSVCSDTVCFLHTGSLGVFGRHMSFQSHTGAYSCQDSPSKFADLELSEETQTALRKPWEHPRGALSTATTNYQPLQMYHPHHPRHQRHHRTASTKQSPGFTPFASS